MSDIVERLRTEEQRMVKLFDVTCVYRDRLEGKAFQDMNAIKHAISGRDPVLEPAADEIASLRARLAEVEGERDRLREAAQRVVHDYPVEAGTLPADLGDPKGPRAKGYGSIRLLRAALEDQS